jgi:hypothetical protein
LSTAERPPILVDRNAPRLIAAQRLESEQYAAVRQLAYKLVGEMAEEQVRQLVENRDPLALSAVGLFHVWRWFSEEADVSATGQVTATSQVAKSTLLTQFAALPCGQRFAVILIFLCALSALDLPPDVRDYIAYLIGVFSAALWLVSKVSKS